MNDTNPKRVLNAAQLKAKAAGFAFLAGPYNGTPEEKLMMARAEAQLGPIPWIPVEGKDGTELWRRRDGMAFAMREYGKED